jgi:hypothetical protein
MKTERVIRNEGKPEGPRENYLNYLNYEREAGKLETGEEKVQKFVRWLNSVILNSDKGKKLFMEKFNFSKLCTLR